MTAVATGARAALWVVGLTLGVLLLSSLFRQPLTLPQAAALAAFTGLSLLRSVDALLLLAAFGPLAGVLGLFFDSSFSGARLVETLVLLLITGWIAAQVRWVRSARWRHLDWALLGFAVVVATSAAAHLPVLALIRGTDSVPQLLSHFFLADYLQHPAGFDVITEAVLLLEGAALCALISRVAADPMNARRVAGMAIAGATGAAVLNVYRLLEVALRRGPLTETFGATFTSLRINTQFGDVNAAGSYFAMMFVAAVGLSGFTSRRGAAYSVAAAPLGIAVWLTGSRTAIAASVLGVLAAVLIRNRERASLIIRSRKRLLGTAALALIAVAALTILPKARSATVTYSVFARTELAKTAFRMLGDRPMLGVGISRFYDLFPQYASPQLREAFFQSALVPVTRENAHNNFLQILAELGAVGFGVFVVVLWLALRPDRPDANPAGVRVPLVVALGTFLFTALFGHPLLTREVAYPFWILLGVAAAGAPDVGGKAGGIFKIAIGSLVVLLAIATPLRAGYERRSASLQGLALGMSNWQRDESGNLFRWAGRRSTLFYEPHSPVIRLPLRAAASTCTVEMWIGGRAGDRITIPSDFWHDVRLRVPAAQRTGRSIRIDLIVADCGGAAADQGRPLMVGHPAELGAPSGLALPR